MRDDVKYAAALGSFVKFGPAALKKIMASFPDFETAFKADARELANAGINENVAAEFSAARKNIDPDEIMSLMEKEKIGLVIVGSANYPKLLGEIYDPPALLFFKGETADKNKLSLAVVGTRKFSHYGRQVAERFSYDLAKMGFSIVSGLALGIDTLAHNAALQAGGRTIAVLGTGIDSKSVYPYSNRYLAEKIAAQGGMVMSEFPLGSPPMKHHFPRRNRIISGLSLGTLVIEAGERSGALITAEFALEQNREVFAVPGSIFSPVSAGPNKLIRRGAKAVTALSDIAEEMDFIESASFRENKEILPETAEESLILKQLSHEPRHIDTIIRLTNLDVSVINSTLILMEMKGMVKNIEGMRYVKTC